MLKTTTVAVLLLFAFVSCKDNKTAQNTNPLMKKSTLPFQAPPFDQIKASDFLPAFKKGMKKQMNEVQKIAGDTTAPTFQNTFVPLEKSGQLLTRVQHDFNILTSADTNPKLQKVQEKVSPKLAAHYDAIYLNPKLFKRIKTIYNNRKDLGLDHESKRLVEYYYKKFVRAGANLSEEDKAKLKKLNEKAASLSTQFTNKLLAATKDGALIVDDTTKLRGLSESQLKTARQNAENRDLSGKWVLTLQNTTQQPELAELQNREIRKKLFEHSWNRAEKGDSNDTRATIKKLAEVRAKKAGLLGFPNYAAWKLTNQMAKTPQTVDHFLAQLVKPSKANAKEEGAELQQIIDHNGSNFELQPYDWEYYAEKLRKKKYDLNTDSVRQYFELNNVLKNGVFYAANQLYGITFKERHDIPVWHKGVRVFEVYDKDGSPLGLFYCDYFKRDNKSGGAWMSNLITQSKLLNHKPVIYNVANFPKPADGEPALLTYGQVTTMFHEFGHALHGFFADEEFPSLSGTSVARDFVEFPSQFNEHWALNPKVFKHYAVHYKTDKPMPQKLVDKIKKAAHFNEGYLFTELLEAALLDMHWHTISADKNVQNVDSFEVKALKDAHIYLPKVPPRYRSSYFMHIWGNGYAAGYYAYLWTRMLSDDAFDWFQNHGGMTRENGQRFRDMILSRGNTEDLGKMFKDFTGHKPDIEPMLKDLGFK
jgi:peptidyl-dipeptidase Dcp